jgi:hypothetical protein
MMNPKKGGLKDRIQAALERGNAGRQAKLSAKADIANEQGNLKKGAKLEMRSKKVALRSEKRQAIKDAKNIMKLKPLDKSKIGTPQMKDASNKYVPTDVKKALNSYKRKMN